MDFGLFVSIFNNWLLIVFYLILLVGLSGVPNTGLGVHNLFHDDPALFVDREGAYRPFSWLNSPAIFVQAAIAVFVTLCWGFIYTMDFIAERHLPEGGMADIVQRTQWLVLLSCAPGLFLGMVAVSGAVRPLVRFEWVRCIAGACVGILVGWLMLRAAVLIEPALHGAIRWTNASGLGLIGIFLPQEIGPTLALMIPAAVVGLGLLNYHALIPGVSIVALFWVLLLFYAAVNLFPGPAHPFIFIGLIALITVFSTASFRRRIPSSLKFEVPNITYTDPDTGETGKDHYRRFLDIDYTLQAGGGSGRTPGEAPHQNVLPASEWLIETTLAPPLTVTEEAAQSVRAAPAQAPDKSEPVLTDRGDVDPLTALWAWKRRVDAAGLKPKLVMVATSGGAYRASFWTALVLDKLGQLDREGTLPGLCGNVRLITGASGGMVGGAYFTAMMGRDEADGRVLPDGTIVDALQNDIYEVQLKNSTVEPGYRYKRHFPLPGDSLSAVAQQLVQQDIPRLFKGGVQKVDRGTVLEDQWKTLDIPFGDLRADEAMARRPSIVFSPMLAETGQPLLIGNLDMQEITGGARRDRAYFFDGFEGSRDSFRVKTAVRLNAAFPFIAPSAALPTEPYLRVVDAGYYDNYGVDLAVSYLSQPAIRDWVIANTDGVMLVEIRAFPFHPPGTANPGNVTRALQFLTTPLDAMLAARGASMRFRNAQSWRRLEHLYYQKTGTAFLNNCVFEVDSTTSLSWYMPGKELTDLRENGLTQARNVDAIDALKAFWAAEAPASG